MGNTRVIFVGAVSVVLGLYSVGLQRSERAVQRVAEVHAYQMQAEEIANGAVSLAINALGNTMPGTLPQLSSISMYGGTGSYMTDTYGLSANEVRITAFGTHEGHTVAREAVVKLTTASTTKKRWSSWQILRVRSMFPASEFSNQFLTE